MNNHPLAKKQVTVLIIEDHPLMASALQNVVEGMEECRLAGIASTPAEARRLATILQPEVITLDIRLAGSAAGVQLASELRSRSEGSRILVCSGFLREGDVATLGDVGIEGWVTKDEPPSVIAAAIRALIAGQTYYSTPVSQIVRRIHRARIHDQAGATRPLSPVKSKFCASWPQGSRIKRSRPGYQLVGRR